jgi:hypothetical protein
MIPLILFLTIDSTFFLIDDANSDADSLFVVELVSILVVSIFLFFFPVETPLSAAVVLLVLWLGDLGLALSPVLSVELL